MERLNEALLTHEALLRREIAAAEERRKKIREEFIELGTKIRTTIADLVDVEAELLRRGAKLPPIEVVFVITEEV